MKNILSLIFILFSSLLISQTTYDSDFLKYPLKSIYTYCQKDSTKLIAEQRLTYDEENRLIKSTYLRENLEVKYTVFNYNNLGLLTSKEFYSIMPVKKLDRIRVYKYNENKNITYEGFDDNKGNNTKINYIYSESGLLAKSTVDCNYTHSEYSYQYDEKDRLTKKLKNNQLEVLYEYSEEKLFKEFLNNRNKDIEILYEYDQNDLLIRKKENGKLVETNIYDESYLIKRWTYYFGIGPCFSQCCNQFITTYEYYDSK